MGSSDGTIVFLASTMLDLVVLKLKFWVKSDVLGVFHTGMEEVITVQGRHFT